MSAFVLAHKEKSMHGVWISHLDSKQRSLFLHIIICIFFFLLIHPWKFWYILIYIYIYIYIYLFLYILLKNKYSYISLCILTYPYVFLYILQYCIFYEILIYSDIYTYIINIFLHIIILTTCAPCFAATLQCLSSCLSMLHVVWIATLPRKDQRRERVRKKKTQMREKVGKWQFIVFFQWFVAPEGRKVGSLKRRVRSQLARWEMKNCTPLWREARFQNVQNTPTLDHFWKLRCRKSARHCGAKHTSKSKCTKHTRSRPLLEVEMSKKCTPLWRREAHVQVKMYKTHQRRTTFGSWDVEKVHAIVARSNMSMSKV